MSCGLGYFITAFPRTLAHADNAAEHSAKLELLPFCVQFASIAAPVKPGSTKHSFAPRTEAIAKRNQGTPLIG